MNAHQAWAASAACAGRLDLPWTRDTADLTAWQAETMRATCAACPVLLDCLAAVDDLDVTGGWWAGRDPKAPAPARAPEWALAWVPVRTRGRGVVALQGALSFDPPASGVGAA